MLEENFHGIWEFDQIVWIQWFHYILEQMETHCEMWVKVFQYREIESLLFSHIQHDKCTI